MRIGDLFEWGAAALAVGAGVDGAHRLWVGLAIAAVFLAYQAQCFGSHELHPPELGRRLRKALRRKK